MLHACSQRQLLSSLTQTDKPICCVLTSRGNNTICTAHICRRKSLHMTFSLSFSIHLSFTMTDMCYVFHVRISSVDRADSWTNLNSDVVSTANQQLASLVSDVISLFQIKHLAFTAPRTRICASMSQSRHPQCFFLRKIVRVLRLILLKY